MLQGAWPLTLPQQDIYLDALDARCAGRYNVGGYIQLGHIDPHRLAASHARLVAQHDIFGLRILAYGGDVVQAISQDRNTALPSIDFSFRSDPEASALAWLDELFQSPLEVEETELFRAYLLKLGEHRYWYAGIAHHIALDGWGFSNWARELARLYASDAPTSPAESWQSVAIDEQSYLKGPRFQRDREYWREQFPKRPRAIFPRKAYERSGTVSSGRVSAALSVEETESLSSLAAAANASPSHVLLAALLCYLVRYSGMESVCIGLPFHNRKNAPQKEMLGVFVGVNLLQMKIDGAESCMQLVERVGRKQREALRYRQYPIGLLVRDLNPRGESKRLYDVGFNYLRFENDLDFGGQQASLHYVPNRHSSTPLMLTAWESTRTEPLQLHLDFSYEYFSDLEAAQTLRRIRQVLGEFVHQPNRRVRDVSVVLDGERSVLGGLRSDLRVDPLGPSLVSRLQEQIASRPDAVAACVAGRSMTFRQLGQMLDAVARRIGERGAISPACVAVCLPRGFALAATIFAIWRMAATVMLLDPEDEVERGEFMLDSGRVGLLVTDPALWRRFLHKSMPSILIGPDLIDAESSQIEPENSSGVASSSDIAALTWSQEGIEAPRLAEVSHAMLERLVQWADSAYSEAELSRVLASTRLSSSAGLFEWVIPLCLGHSIVIASNPVAARHASSKPSLIHVSAPALRQMLVADTIPASVAAVSIHGRAPSQKLIDELASKRPDIHLVQTAGDAEHCYCAIASSLRRDADGVWSGKQHRLLDCAVLTREGDLAPIGWTGELHVTEPSRNARSASPCEDTGEHRNTAIETSRPTGLLARVTSEGRIEIVTSARGLVQSDGYILDVAEIERQAETVADVSAAAARVMSTPVGEELVLLVAGRTKNDTGRVGGKRWADEIRKQLSAHLPPYMVPARIEFIDERCVRSGLQAFAEESARKSMSSERDSATTDPEMESWLAREWASICETPVEDIDPGCDFLASCASVHAMIGFANRISNHCQVDVSPADVVDETSLRSLARSIRALLALRKIVGAATKNAAGLNLTEPTHS